MKPAWQIQKPKNLQIHFCPWWQSLKISGLEHHRWWHFSSSTLDYVSNPPTSLSSKPDLIYSFSAWNISRNAWRKRWKHFPSKGICSYSPQVTNKRTNQKERKRKKYIHETWKSPETWRRLSDWCCHTHYAVTSSQFQASKRDKNKKDTHQIWSSSSQCQIDNPWWWTGRAPVCRARGCVAGSPTSDTRCLLMSSHLQMYSNAFPGQYG